MSAAFGLPPPPPVAPASKLRLISDCAAAPEADALRRAAIIGAPKPSAVARLASSRRERLPAAADAKSVSTRSWVFFILGSWCSGDSPIVVMPICGRGVQPPFITCCRENTSCHCLLYTSDAADDLTRVD